MKLKVDKYIAIDTMRCLNELPVIYTDDNKDLIYSYANKTKSDENYDFDSARFVYTNNEHLRNEYLSKRLSTKKGRFLYKVVFYFKQTYDKRTNVYLPEREAKIEISESDNFDREELEKVLTKYRKVFH